MTPSMTSHSFGDVLLVPFPFTDLTQTKSRPAVVLSSDAYHHDHYDLVIAAITSKPRGERCGEVALLEWQQAGLRRPSVVVPVLATLSRRLILRQLGALATADRKNLRAALDLILGR